LKNKTPLTPKLLKETYHKLAEFYFGSSAFIDSEIDMEWSLVPHFYYNFYVYQYATGISAAIYLAEKVRNGNETDRTAYLNFLKGGSSKYPIDMLKVAGVDMFSQEVVEKTMKVFNRYIDEFEKLLNS